MVYSSALRENCSPTSLTILLPVHNAQKRLEAGVGEILDAAAELTSVFDLVIIDDGSVDDTSDLAGQLARRYPQVKVVRHPIRLGLAEAIQTGLDNSDGEIVFVGDERLGLNPEDLRKLWQLRHDDELIIARRDRAGGPPRGRFIEKLLAWNPQPRPEQGAMHLLRRSALEELEQLAGNPPQSGSVESHPAQKNPVGQPNFLSKAKKFALGE